MGDQPGTHTGEDQHWAQSQETGHPGPQFPIPSYPFSSGVPLFGMERASGERGRERRAQPAPWELRLGLLLSGEGSGEGLEIVGCDGGSWGGVWVGTEEN